VISEEVRLLQNGGAGGEVMRSRRRWIIVGIVGVCGILLVALGIRGLGELLEAGEIPGEMLTSSVRNLTLYTTASLSLGLTMVAWCFITGIAWARSARAGVTGSQTRPSEKR
jgi:hypothetical protein